MSKLRNPSVWTFLACLLVFTACRTSKTADPIEKPVEHASLMAENRPESPVVTSTPAPAVAPSPAPAPVAVAPAEEALPAVVQPFRVASIFSDNMVLQQGMSVPVWGWGTDGETVTVSFRGQKVSARARQGKWTVKLRDLHAGGPDVLTVTGSTSLQFTNVLVGEVWLCSGQSNMEWPLSKSFEPEADIASAANPMIRLFTVPKVKADAPLADLKMEDRSLLWREATPETVPTFSAVAYYFARELHKARGVPIGLIQSSWGGSPAEAWTRHEVLQASPRYRKEILEKYASDKAAYEAALAAFAEQKTELVKVNSTKKVSPPRAPWKPSELYNGMIAPIVPFAIKGAIWYQGESNAGRAHQYRSLFPHMIQNWREDWDQGDFPFICVQLAPFKPKQPQPVDSDWAELREAQLLATKTVPAVGMAVITDVGEEYDIHPTKKAPVGARLALAARGLAYDESLTYSGPIYREMKISGNEALIHFDHVGSGLEVRGTSLKGFSICGADRKFYWAVAEIRPGNIVAVHSPNVSVPVAVRYGWADYPVINLWNKAGLPASPFRTDDFPMVTAPKP